MAVNSTAKHIDKNSYYRHIQNIVPVISPNEPNHSKS